MRYLLDENYSRSPSKAKHSKTDLDFSINNHSSSKKPPHSHSKKNNTSYQLAPYKRTPLNNSKVVHSGIETSDYQYGTLIKTQTDIFKSATGTFPKGLHSRSQSGTLAKVFSVYKEVRNIDLCSPTSK